MKILEIKFSHRYKKMPADVELYESFVRSVEIKHYNDLTSEFIKYDTEYDGGFYPLPKTKLLIVVIWSGRKISETEREATEWTTVRRWTLEKERWYKSLIDKEVNIIIKQIDLPKSAKNNENSDFK